MNSAFHIKLLMLIPLLALLLACSGEEPAETGRPDDERLAEMQECCVNYAFSVAGAASAGAGSRMEHLRFYIYKNDPGNNNTPGGLYSSAVYEQEALTGGNVSLTLNMPRVYHYISVANAAGDLFEEDPAAQISYRGNEQFILKARHVGGGSYTCPEFAFNSSSHTLAYSKTPRSGDTLMFTRNVAGIRLNLITADASSTFVPESVSLWGVYPAFYPLKGVPVTTASTVSLLQAVSGVEINNTESRLVTEFYTFPTADAAGAWFNATNGPLVKLRVSGKLSVGTADPVDKTYVLSLAEKPLKANHRWTIDGTLKPGETDIEAVFRVEAWTENSDDRDIDF